MQEKSPAVMYGPAFDDSGDFVQRVVPHADIVAFEKAGYVRGTLPDHLKPKVKEEPKARETKSPKADDKSK